MQILVDGQTIEAVKCDECGARMAPASLLSAHKRAHRDLNTKLKSWGRHMPEMGDRYTSKGSRSGIEKPDNVKQYMRNRGRYRNTAGSMKT